MTLNNVTADMENNYELEWYAKQYNEALKQSSENTNGNYIHFWLPEGMNGPVWYAYKASVEGDRLFFTCLPGDKAVLKPGQKVKEFDIDIPGIQEEIRAIVEQWAETSEEIEAWMGLR